MHVGVDKRLVAAVGALVFALALAAVASADKEQIHLTAAGQAAARAAVLTRADLGSATGWTGGHKKPDLSSTPLCSGFDPKQSDLIVIGASRTEYTHTGVDLSSEAQVLKTPAMVQLDWKRSVLAPQLLPCLRQVAAKSAGASAKVVSVRRVAFPHVATNTGAIRILVDVTSGSSTIRVFIDTVVIGRGRTEITLTTTAPLVASSVIHAAEVKLARALAGRAS